jgi:hypothetical protein
MCISGNGVNKNRINMGGGSESGLDLYYHVALFICYKNNHTEFCMFS